MGIPGFRNWVDDPTGGSEPETHIYQLINGQWQRIALLPGRFGPLSFDREIALIVGSDRARGELLRLNRRGADGAWNLRTSLYTEESFNLGRFLNISGNRAYTSDGADLRGPHSGSLSVFERDSQGRYIHRATLLASDGGVRAAFWVRGRTPLGMDRVWYPVQLRFRMPMGQPRTSSTSSTSRRSLRNLCGCRTR